VQVTLAASPSGLSLTLDGQPVVAPFTFRAVVGIQRTLGAPSPQTSGPKVYDFRSWSDGGAQTHTISTPASNATFTATYQKRKGRRSRLACWRTSSLSQDIFSVPVAQLPGTMSVLTMMGGRIVHDRR
jgi:hypothetical protein